MPDPYQELIKTINHRVHLWTELLDYASQEIEVRDPAHDVVINLRPPEVAVAVSIPTIEVTFGHEIELGELAAIALDLINVLANSSLDDFCDFQLGIHFDHRKRSFKIEFHDYNIKRG